MKRIMLAALILVGSIVLGPLVPGATTASGAPSLPQATTGPDQHVDDPQSPPLLSAASLEVQADDQHFVANSGGDLDQYLFRENVPNGRLAFEIPITRYYSNLIAPGAVDGNGFLDSAVLDKLTRQKLLPDSATLRLRVWDVDEDYAECPEVDYVYVNGQRIPESGAQATLSGANDTWSAVSFMVPTKILRFPTSKGTSGQTPSPALNEIEVEINALQCLNPYDPTITRWAVAVDWGVIEIPSPIRPVVFAHGWTGDVQAFNAFQDFMALDGIPSAAQVDLLRGIQPVAQTSPVLAAAIQDAALEFGVNKVNLFAHSKGGLVSRHALRSSTVAGQVEHLITFGSPHHGAALTSWAWTKCNKQFSSETDQALCREAADELSKERIRNEFNYQGCEWTWWPLPPHWTGCQARYVRQPDVAYVSVAGNRDVVANATTATYPWRADQSPYPSKPNVDRIFGCGLNYADCHGLIKESQESYCYAIGRLDPGVQSDVCASAQVAVAPSIVVSAPTLADDSDQPALQAAGILGAGQALNMPVTIDTVGRALFNVYTTQPLAALTLLAPDGSTVLPSTPNVAYAAQQDPAWGWWHQYSIDAPAAGQWQLRVAASNATSYSADVLVQSGIAAYLATDKRVYDLNETVTVQAALVDGAIALTGAAIQLTVTRPDDTTLSVGLVDDGSGGDTTAADGIYAAQFDSSSVSGHHQLALSAHKGQISRLASGSIAATAQTASVGSGLDAVPVDDNGNGLYDHLVINLSLNVQTAGHFEVLGDLVDVHGRVVAAASFATRRDGTGPLSVGLHTIPLTFSGTAIRAYGVDGPYLLTNVVVEDQTVSSLQVDAAGSVFTTPAYEAIQFEGPTVSLAETAEVAIDLDDSGRYDLLRLGLALEVVHPGSYEINGRLVDRHGHEIAWDAAVFDAPSSGAYWAQLDFDGYAIGLNGVDGPYVLQDVSVFNRSGPGSHVFGHMVTTQAYGCAAFEGGPLAIYLPLVLKSGTSQ